MIYPLGTELSTLLQMLFTAQNSFQEAACKGGKNAKYILHTHCVVIKGAFFFRFNKEQGPKDVR